MTGHFTDSRSTLPAPATPARAHPARSRDLRPRRKANTKVIAIGDPGQLASVQAGGWFAEVARRHPGAQLRQVIRQRDPPERAALEALHDGHPDVHLEHKRAATTIQASEADAVADLVSQWNAARQAHGITGAVMLARDNQTREQLNHAARQRLKRGRALPERGVQVADREFAPGDRIVARRNHPGADIDNGTLATVLAIDDRTHRMIIDTGHGQHRELDLAYVAQHVEPAYALTAHSAQGSTVSWAGVVGRPHEFTREWAYTALSRARRETTLHVIAEPSRESRARQAFAPLEPNLAREEVLIALERHMRRSEREPLALDDCALRDPLGARTVTAPIRLSHSPLSTSLHGPTVHR
ncbi:MAG TPA: AAA family ATPase [Solirubrobacteraceae bacterium]|nr:AAA family ATPase [Solirubrobacteraceae bacterium]